MKVIYTTLVCSLIIVATLVLLPTADASTLPEYGPWGDSCPNFTDEQLEILELGKIIGGQRDEELWAAIGDTIPYTTTAIITREGFVGPYVIRQNPADGPGHRRVGAYGVMQVLITTSFHMRDLRYTWRNRSLYEGEIITTMINNDREAIEEGVQYLTEMIVERQDLWAGVRAYNGAGAKAEAYMNDIKVRVAVLQKCGF